MKKYFIGGLLFFCMTSFLNYAMSSIIRQRVQQSLPYVANIMCQNKFMTYGSYMRGLELSRLNKNVYPHFCMAMPNMNTVPQISGRNLHTSLPRHAPSSTTDDITNQFTLRDNQFEVAKDGSLHSGSLLPLSEKEKKLLMDIMREESALDDMTSESLRASILRFQQVIQDYDVLEKYLIQAQHYLAQREADMSSSYFKNSPQLARLFSSFSDTAKDITFAQKIKDAQELLSERAERLNWPKMLFKHC